MPRVKRGSNRRDRRRKTLSRAKGYYLGKSKLYKFAREAEVRLPITPPCRAFSIAAPATMMFDCTLLCWRSGSLPGSCVGHGKNGGAELTAPDR